MSEKLQKVLARAGLGSRREIERWIEAGRIKVDGKAATIGDRIALTAKVIVDGKKIDLTKLTPTQTRLILYNKPEGEICSRSDPEGRPTVFEQLPELAKGRWISIGRLDINTSGLLLFTDDGELANQLMHPRSNLDREYAVRVLGEVSDATITKLTRGVKLEDGLGKFESIIDTGGTAANHWLTVIVKEGRNRLVRRLWEAVDIQVSRLIRIRFGPFQLPRDLKMGRWIEVDKKRINK